MPNSIAQNETFFAQKRIEKYRCRKIKERVAKGELSRRFVRSLYDANDDLFNTPIIGAEVYRSNNGGKTWQKTNTKSLPRLYNTYGYYFGRISVSPANEDKIVVMGVSIEVSTDGGKTFTDMDAANVHSDHHACWMNPLRDNHMIIG